MTALNRDFDVIVYGATGYTGRLLAAELSRMAPPELRWALGGRNRARLEEVRHELAADGRIPADLPIVLGDASRPETLGELARRTAVVATTVGPYARLGEPLVAACAEAGTDYADLTGEPHFVRAMIDGYHARAVASGARIVHCCGFDSIPSDLGVLVLAEHCRARGAERAGGASALGRVRFYLRHASGGVSGGTTASMFGVFEAADRDPDLLRRMESPYYLAPDPEHDLGPSLPDAKGIRFDGEIERWCAPFIMAAINTRVVHRSNALAGYRYGRDLVYSEEVAVGGALAVGAAGAIALGGAVGQGLGRVRALREAARRFLPQSGEGPSPERLARGSFRVELRATAPGARAAHAQAVVAAPRDPGYGGTAVMLAASTLCLVATRAQGAPGGVLTPATALGLALAERLRGAGFTLEASELP